MSEHNQCNNALCSCNNHSHKEFKDDSFFAKKWKNFYIWDLIKLSIGLMLFIVCLVLFFTILDFHDHHNESNPFLEFSWQQGVMFGLFFINILIVGYDLLWRGLKDLIRLRFNEMSLMLVAIIAAFVIGEYIEASIVIMLFKIGQMAELFAEDKNQININNLLKIQSNKAIITSVDNKQTEVDAASVKVNETILVRPGDKIPLDCIVVSGHSLIDDSTLTGESLTKQVTKGSKLLSGSINISNVLICKTISDYDNSTASKIVKLVLEAQKTKSSSEKFVTKFAKIYTPIVIICAILIATIPLAFVLNDWMIWLNSSLAFLLAACPCALVISIPLAYSCCIGLNSKIGVLIKGSKYVERLSKTEIIYFDKTNTITDGKLQITNIKTSNGFDKQKLLDYVSSLENNSNHAIANTLKNLSTSLLEVKKFKQINGKGVCGFINKQKVIVGNKNFMLENKINLDEHSTTNLGTNIYISLDKMLIGVITLNDTIKQEAKQAINNFRYLGVKHLVLLSGDDSKMVEFVANEIKLNPYYGELLPNQKVEKMKELNHGHQNIVFVGDGINDGPSLASADVGVAMGIGTDIAVDTADVVLGNNNLNSLAKSIYLCKRTNRLVKFNLVLILFVKFIVFSVILICSSLALDFNTIWLGVAADTGLTILCVLNAIRILKFKTEIKIKKQKHNDICTNKDCKIST